MQLRQRARRELRDWRDEPMRAVALRGRLQHPLRVRRFHRFGAGSILHRPTWLYGPHQIGVGDGSVLLRGVWLSVEREAWGNPAPVLDIGDRVWVRPFCTISAARSIVIEDDVVLGSMVTVIDSDHTWDAGIDNVLFNPVTSAPVRVGKGTWLADRVAVLKGSDIGEHCIVGTNSVVRGKIPDYSIAVGAPARVVGSTRG